MADLEAAVKELRSENSKLKEYSASADKKMKEMLGTIKLLEERIKLQDQEIVEVRSAALVKSEATYDTDDDHLNDLLEGVFGHCCKCSLGIT